MRSTTRHFLVMRGTEDSGSPERLRSILVFEAHEIAAALEAYAKAEQRGIDCVLLGADSIATLCITHSTWMDCSLGWTAVGRDA